MNPLQKLLITYAIVSVSAAPAIHPYAGLSSVKGSLVACLSTIQQAAQPIIATIQKYPQLTVAFTVLSCLCISAVQDIVQKHQAIRSAESKRPYLDLHMTQRKSELEKLEKKEKDLEAALALEHSKHTNLDSRIRLRKARINLNARVQSVARAAISEHSMLQDASIDATLQTTKQSLGQLQANLAAKQQELHHLQQSPETQECMIENRKRASIIKNRAHINLDTVLSDAQTLVEKNAQEKDEIRALQKQISNALEQVKSIKERYELAYQAFHTKYEKQLYGETRDFYHEYTEQDNYYGIVTPLATLTDISSRFDRSGQRMFDHLLYGGPRNCFEPNLLAKENFDAYLLGAQEVARIKPSKEQYERAHALHKQLNTKWFALESALDPRRIEPQKPELPIAQPETSLPAQSLGDPISNVGEPHATK